MKYIIPLRYSVTCGFIFMVWSVFKLISISRPVMNISSPLKTNNHRESMEIDTVQKNKDDLKENNFVEGNAKQKSRTSMSTARTFEKNSISSRRKISNNSEFNEIDVYGIDFKRRQAELLEKVQTRIRYH